MAAPDRTAPALCPSARARPGAAVIGLIGLDGRVAYLKDWVEIDQTFIDDVSVDGRPEQFYRFADTCAKEGCVQWDGDQCTVPSQVAAQVAPDTSRALPACMLRTACRWFRQSGPEACRLCPMVITDTRGDAAA